MDFMLYRPASLDEAARLQKQTGGRYLAGGTVLFVNSHKGMDIGKSIISLENIPAMRDIYMENDALVIGANATFDDIEKSDVVKNHAYALWQAACEVGGPQIRHRATLGGNIAAAFPAADGVTPLMALNASVRVFGIGGWREIPMENVITGYQKSALSADEIISSIIIPIYPASKSLFMKVGKRTALTVSCVNVAAAMFDDGNVRVAVGSAAPEVRLCRKTGEILTNDINAVDEACRAMLTEISPRDDRWGTVEYRKMVCQNMLKNIIERLGEVRA